MCCVGVEVKVGQIFFNLPIKKAASSSAVRKDRDGGAGGLISEGKML